MARPTIADIAAAAGVSSTAVSFALNGRPGVAEPTRERILAIANRMGWTPNAAARALSTSRVDAFGLIITAPYDELAGDAFFLQFIAGVERALAKTPIALVLKIVEDFDDELEAIRSWHGASRVDALVLVNPRPEDPRPGLVQQLGVPAVFVGQPDSTEPFSSIHIDDALAMRQLAEDLADLGATSLLYVHSHGHLAHGKARLSALDELDEPRLLAAHHAAVHGEDTVGQIATILTQVQPQPTTVVCENEELTLAAMEAARNCGLRIPDDLGLVSWESTPGLISRRPHVATLERSPAVMGEAAVGLLQDLLAHPGEPRRRDLPTPRLHARETVRDSAVDA